tara:strand:+ start:5617 stop:6213 length:597 start_codon:yes stop_codon:yes gene_type:complete
LAKVGQIKEEVMASPLSVKKNNYIKNPKRADIETPEWVCEEIYKVISEKYDIKKILDPSSGNNRLTAPWKGVEVTEFELKRGQNFLEQTEPVDVDLVLCNPPFNLGVGRRLGSEVFLEHAMKIAGDDTPMVLFTPMGFRLNQRKKSKRIHWLKNKAPEITSIVSLTLDVFDQVQFHSEILFFNMPKLKPHYIFLQEVN